MKKKLMIPISIVIIAIMSLLSPNIENLKTNDLSLTNLINTNVANAECTSGNTYGSQPNGEWFSFGTPHLVEDTYYGYDSNGNMGSVNLCFWDCQGWSGSC